MKKLSPNNSHTITAVLQILVETVFLCLMAFISFYFAKSIIPLFNGYAFLAIALIGLVPAIIWRSLFNFKAFLIIEILLVLLCFGLVSTAGNSEAGLLIYPLEIPLIFINLTALLGLTIKRIYLEVQTHSKKV